MSRRRRRYTAVAAGTPRSLLSLLLVGLGALACGGAAEPLRPRSLLGEVVRPAADDGDGGTGAATPVEPRRVLVAASWREAVETEPGAPLAIELGERPGTSMRLELAIAARRPERGSGGVAGARLELVAGGGEEGDGRTLLDDRLVPADGWVRHSLPLPADARGELRLSSTGPAPVVWTELYLRPATRREDGRDPGEPASATDPHPSIVLVSLDTVRADHLSLYGYPRATSPNLDRFAADAWVFANSWSTSTWTLPSHGTMFTGLLPDRHGLRQVEDTLADEVTTIAERLRRAGYRTAAITDGGFLDPHWGFAQGFERYDVSAGPAWAPKDAAAIFGAAARWVEENRWRPFFLFVHSYEAHQPYVNRDGFADPFLDAAYDGRFTGRADVLAAADAIRPFDHARIRALYDGGIRRLDHHLGIFLRRLERRGVLDRTAVIITSDHGEELGEHGGWEHVAGKLFEENVRVPLVVHPPGGLEESADRFPTTPVTTLDLYPTLVDLAGLTGPDGGAVGEDAGNDESAGERGARSLVRAGRSLLAIARGSGDGERTVLLHGLNSSPDHPEVRYRLDRGDRTLLFDRRRGTASRFDRRLDPGMQRPLPALDEGGRGAGLMTRLQVALAWLEPEAIGVRLPSGSRRVELPGGAGFTLDGAWNGLERQPSATRLELDPARPALVLLTRVPGGGGRELAVESGHRSSPLELKPMAEDDAAAFHPLTTDPPPPATLIPSARRHRSTVAEPDRERRRELEALGYL